MVKLNTTSAFIFFLFAVVFIFFVFNNIHRSFAKFNVTSVCELPRFESDDTYNCALSRAESNGFFCETDEDWSRRKDLFHLQHNRNRFLNSTSMFFQDNYEPTFSCRFEQRLGINGDGGKWICDVYRLKQLSTCLIYSLGSNGEFSFENQTKYYLPNCDIHTFDMKLFTCSNFCIFHKVRIGNGLDGTKTLRMMMSDLNHTERHLDILKIDIEGSEYEFFEELFRTKDRISENIHQILLEIHLAGLIKTVNNIAIYDYTKIHRLFQLFHDNHFVIFHKEANLFNPHIAFEFSFIRLHENFFQVNHTAAST